MNAIEIKGLTKKYKDITAVDNVSLEIAEGKLFSLLGENGAGKSTTIKMLCSLINPTSGSATMMGYDLITENDKIKKFTDVSPQETAVAANLSVKENLILAAELYGSKKQAAAEKAESIMRELKLKEVENKYAKKLSGGFQRRLSIGMALISEPKILFLDEPTLGLDVRAKHDLWDVINSIKGKTTIILTTHYMEEAEALSDTVAVICHGKIIAKGTVKELETQTETDSLEKAFLKLTDEGTYVYDGKAAKEENNEQN